MDGVGCWGKWKVCLEVEMVELRGEVVGERGGEVIRRGDTRDC